MSTDHALRDSGSGPMSPIALFINMLTSPVEAFDELGRRPSKLVPLLLVIGLNALVIFWYFSVGGGLTLLAYAVYRRDPVFILGQSLGLLVYIRNLVLIYRRAWAYRELLADRAEAARDESSAGVSVTGTSEPSPAS